MEFLSQLFDTSDFPSRWNCGTWTVGHGWLHVLSDLGVWSAYVAIPCVLGFFLLRRKDLPFRMIFLLFGAFILACGTTHLMEAIIFWWPAYRLAGIIKLFTALVSWGTVYALIPVVPKALAMRSPEDLEREVEARKSAEGALQHANDALEQRIADRTAELVRANADLQLERERFHTTLASIGDAVIATDIQGGITFLNPIAQALTGWSEREAVGQPLEKVFRIINEETRQEVDSPALRALREGRIVGLANHTLLIAKDGTERPIDDSAAPIRNGDRLDGAVLVFRDIGNRKLSEIRLRQMAADLSEADRRKNEFLAILAHELRNPLAPIRNALSILQLTSGKGEAFQAASELMDRQVRHMVRLVDDLLDVSRISRGMIELRRERVDLAAILQQAVETNRPGIDAARHELTLSLPTQPVVMHADPVRLAQAFSNLLNNSCKYCEPGGRIALTADRQGNEVVVAVKDNGIGIPPDMLHSIFEMFTQADRSLERTQGGLGIGLTLVQRLVELHGGSVHAISEGPGRGTEFIVRLPISSEAAPLPGTTKIEPSPAARLRILVVDDNRDSATSLATLLKLAGNDTHVAFDGITAVAAAAALRPDVALLDIGMPNLNGYDAARQIRSQPWGKHMILVAVTGWGQEEDRRKSEEAGFDGHLVKPVEYAALMTFLASLASQRK